MKGKLVAVTVAMGLLLCLAVNSYGSEGVLFEGFEDDSYSWGRWPTWGAGAKTVELTNEWKTQGEKSAKFTYVANNPHSAACFSTNQKEILDWSKYSKIRFDVNNPNGRTIEVNVRLQDSWSAYYELVEGDQKMRVFLEEGESTVTLPLNLGRKAADEKWPPIGDQKMVLSDIQYVVLVVVDEGVEGSLLVDNFVLLAE